MWVYSSQMHLFILSAVSLLGLVWVVMGQNPLQTIWRAVVTLTRDRRTLVGVAGVILILGLNAMETRWEAVTPSTVHWDFTDEIARVGGELLQFIQKAAWPPLTHVMTYFYVVLFPLFGITSLIVYEATGNRRSLDRLFQGFFINYIVALPFYVLFPVKEAWAADTSVHFLIPSVYPAFEASYRALSGLDNCFPSLHTSLALTYAFVALRSGHYRLATVLSFGAAMVVTSTLYLGVHWPLDVVAGTVLALFAASRLPDALFRPAQTGHWDQMPMR